MAEFPSILCQDYLERFLAKPNESIWEHTQAVLARADALEQLGYVANPKLKISLDLAIRLHDLGKLGQYFQRRIRLNDRYKKFDPTLETGHNILSLCLAPLREEVAPELTEDEYFRVLYAIWNHHHYEDNISAIQRCDAPSFDRQIRGHQSNNNVTLRKRLFRMVRAFDLQAVQLTGLLMRCDHAASAQLAVEYPPGFIEPALEYCLEKWRKRNPEADWRELQRYARAHRGENLIIRAQTGMGKTEAALQWMGDHKAFFVLPLRTAINAIYDRVCELLPSGYAKEETVGLLHSDALSHILSKEEHDLQPDLESQEREWTELDYQKRSRGLMLPLSITTPDQIFDIVFKYAGSEAKLATLAYSRIVIDEIQAYSPDLLAYIIYGLELLHRLGARFMIMTATLPPFVRDLIDEALASDMSAPNGAASAAAISDTSQKEKPLPQHYKMMSFTDQQLRHHLAVREEKINAKFIDQLFCKREAQKLPNKILVICNTVKKAQKLYSELQHIRPVRLIHAKFIQQERKALESEILRDGLSDCEKSIIWIATQIVEASLDIDFDCLVTELADLPGLMQRLGRVNRKGFKSTEEANCFVFTEIDSNLLMDDSGKKGFIDPAIYLLSREAILAENGLLSESDKIRLIDEWLTSDQLKLYSRPFTGYLSAYRSFRDYVKGLYVGQVDAAGSSHLLRNIDTESIIPEPVFRLNKKFILDTFTHLQNLQSDLRCADRGKLSRSEKQAIYVQMEKLKLKLRAYSLSVPRYDVHRYGPAFDLGGRETLTVSACYYDSQCGFVRMNAKEMARFNLHTPKQYDAWTEDNPIL